MVPDDGRLLREKCLPPLTTMQTEPLPSPWRRRSATALADSDSLRYNVLKSCIAETTNCIRIHSALCRLSFKKVQQYKLCIVFQSSLLFPQSLLTLETKHARVIGHTAPINMPPKVNTNIDAAVQTTFLKRLLSFDDRYPS